MRLGTVRRQIWLKWVVVCDASLDELMQNLATEGLSSVRGIVSALVLTHVVHDSFGNGTTSAFCLPPKGAGSESAKSDECQPRHVVVLSSRHPESLEDHAGFCDASQQLFPRYWCKGCTEKSSDPIHVTGWMIFSTSHLGT